MSPRTFLVIGDTSDRGEQPTRDAALEAVAALRRGDWGERPGIGLSSLLGRAAGRMSLKSLGADRCARTATLLWA